MANLCTTSDYKAYKKIEHFKDDSQIDVLVNSISELVKTYCGSTLIDYYGSDKTEVFDIFDIGTAEVFLTESPLVSVSSVQERDSITDSYTTLTVNTDYYVDT